MVVRSNFFILRLIDKWNSLPSDGGEPVFSFLICYIDKSVLFKKKKTQRGKSISLYNRGQKLYSLWDFIALSIRLIVTLTNRLMMPISIHFLIGVAVFLLFFIYSQPILNKKNIKSSCHKKKKMLTQLSFLLYKI